MLGSQGTSVGNKAKPTSTLGARLIISSWCRKDAAQKWLHSLLGHDPRWIKPKSQDEQDQRMAGLKAACNPSKRKKIQQGIEDPRRNADATSKPSFTTLRDFDAMDGLTLDPSHGSIFADSDGSTLGNASWLPAENNLQITYDPLSHNSQQYQRNSFFPVPYLFSRATEGQQRARRQDSSLSNSTDPSITSSFRGRLSGTAPGQVKAAYELSQ